MTVKPFPQLKKSLLAMLGPSVVFVALSLNGGEMLLWPSLVASFGLAILWPVLIILFFQFFVNIEIERYTLVTGKRVESALVQGKTWIAVLFGITTLVSLVWPAWITTAGNILAVLLKIPLIYERNVGLAYSIALLLLTLLIFRRPGVYKILEKITRLGLSLALVIILVTVILKFDGQIFTEGLKGLFQFGFLPESLPRFEFLAALAYGGVAGILNLVQSEWIKDKGYGVNSLPAGAQEVELDSENSKHNFRHWFKAINQEHALLFLVANALTIFLLAYLGRLLVPLGTAQGFGVLRSEILALNLTIPFVGTLFGLASMLLFIMANLVILDASGRLLSRILTPLAVKYKRPALQDNQRLSIWTALAGIAILVLSLLVPSFKQPFFLLVVSASLGAFSMWLYPPLLIKLNLSLPKVARPKLWRILLVLVCSLGYGFLTIWAVSDFVPLWLLLPITLLVLVYQAKVLFFNKI